MKNLNNPSNYKLIQTLDQSYTFWSEEFQESCHSTQGAYSETKYTYIEGCRLRDKMARQDNINIFEVGFGIGLGLLATVDFFNENSQGKEKTFQFFSVEKDHRLIEWAKSNNRCRHDRYPCISDLECTNENNLKFYFAKKNGCSICVVVGDARKTVPEMIKNEFLPSVHCIYQDPFSPRKNPALWTVEWFKLLGSISHPDVDLATFSSATAIRKSLFHAGWVPRDVPGTGGKKSNTLARLDGTIAKDLELRFKRSHKEALFDKMLQR